MSATVLYMSMSLDGFIAGPNAGPGNGLGGGGLTVALYVIIDVFSRYAVGWTVSEKENADVAKMLLRETARKQPCAVKISAGWPLSEALQPALGASARTSTHGAVVVARPGSSRSRPRRRPTPGP